MAAANRLLSTLPDADSYRSSDTLLLAFVQELKQLLAIACHKESRLLVLGVSNSITLIEDRASELGITASQCWTCSVCHSDHVAAVRMQTAPQKVLQKRFATATLNPLSESVSACHQVSDTQKVVFYPYSRQQMTSILRQQLEQLPGPAFEPMALSLCAAKVCN